MTTTLLNQLVPDDPDINYVDIAEAGSFNVLADTEHMRAAIAAALGVENGL